MCKCRVPVLFKHVYSRCYFRVNVFIFMPTWKDRLKGQLYTNSHQTSLWEISEKQFSVSSCALRTFERSSVAKQLILLIGYIKLTIELFFRKVKRGQQGWVRMWHSCWRRCEVTKRSKKLKMAWSHFTCCIMCCTHDATSSLRLLGDSWSTLTRQLNQSYPINAASLLNHKCRL